MDKILLRCFSIVRRYGLSSERFKNTLIAFLTLMRRHGIVPTLPVTASVLERHSVFFNRIAGFGAELAIHGYRHCDYTGLTKKQAQHEFQRAILVFKQNNIPIGGHRFPFLRKDADLIDMLADSGFRWDSSEVISWNSINPNQFKNRDWKNYQNILKTYGASDAEASLALPRFQGGLVELPVSVPDDDILIERLRLNDEKKLKEIWERMLVQIRLRGELLVLQLHPERFHLYKNALDQLLDQAKAGADVWVAPLGKITEWWIERDAFSFDVAESSETRFCVSASCTNRASILLQNPLKRNSAGIQGFGVEEVIQQRQFIVDCPVKPLIGIARNASTSLRQFLKSEGYAFEETAKPERYAFFLESNGEIAEEHKLGILDTLDHAPYPLLRFWRWPGAARYALAVTGDIDNVTIRDYWDRFNGYSKK